MKKNESKPVEHATQPKNPETAALEAYHARPVTAP